MPRCFLLEVLEELEMEKASPIHDEAQIECVRDCNSFIISKKIELSKVGDFAGF